MPDDHLVIQSSLFDDDGVVVSLSGPVGVKTYERLEAALEEFIRADRIRMILDMSKVQYISSAGAGVLMNAYSQCRDKNGSFVLTNLSNAVLEIFDLLNLYDVLPIATDMNTAIALMQSAESVRKS
jgi:anti-sigma B factor antagonist